MLYLIFWVNLNAAISEKRHMLEKQWKNQFEIFLFVAKCWSNLTIFYQF